MSSGNMPRAQHPALFLWTAGLDPAQYVRARYRVTSIHDGDATAMAMAMEQSCATTAIAGHVAPGMLGEWTIRVLDVRAAGSLPPSELQPYQLETEVYAAQGEGERDWEVELAIPRRLLAGKPAQLLNVAVGELPRLGFLTRFQLTALDLPGEFGPGPGFGIAGIRRAFGCARGPLLCRSMRPAVGLATTTMAALNRDVLVGGFHLVKDDELQVFDDNQAFRAHVQAMVAARDAARERTGQQKGYLANLICEPDELGERWDIVQEHGVDAVLVAPAIQGLGTLSMLARQRRIPILSHNTFSDLLTRHSRWGIAHDVLDGWLERFGADWYVTSGEHGQAADQGGAPAPLRATQAMPILQGGKHPQGLPGYRASIGNDDYMLIVASWVDAHPQGLEAAARVFRTAVDAQAG
jgi:ribulose 1,5-bisphosphate carboxylase large subunit-like protein